MRKVIDPIQVPKRESINWGMLNESLKEPWYKRILMYFGVKFKKTKQEVEKEWKKITEDMIKKQPRQEEIEQYLEKGAERLKDHEIQVEKIKNGEQVGFIKYGA